MRASTKGLLRLKKGVKGALKATYESGEPESITI